MFRGSFRGSSGGGGGGGGADITWSSKSYDGSAYAFAAGGNLGVYVNVSGGAVEVQLPSAAANSGKVYYVKHETGDLATNALTITSPTSGNVEGLTTLRIYQTQSTTKVSSNGTNWLIV